MKPSVGPRKPKKRKITFVLDAPGASEVFLAGDFNAWGPRAHPMQTDGNSRWVTELRLGPGRYEYKFVVDGQWVTDPANARQCPNCFGTDNSVITVAA